jgi:GNAT superfamily N-acetyltransferase
MHAGASLSSNEEVLPLRTRYRQGMNCQIVHDSIHTRPGWTTSYLLEIGGMPAGFGTVAIGGPWTTKPTLLEFYVLPEHRARSFDLFDSLLSATGVNFIEVQSNDSLLAVMFHAYAGDIASESIVFYDSATTALAGNGATLRCVTGRDEIKMQMEERAGGPEWLLELDGQAAGKGGILFHYNPPFGDAYMEVNESFRGRGLGSYLVQELKRAAYDLGAVPCARCNTSNIASRRTLQRAGFVPYSHMLTGTIRSPTKVEANERA